MSLQCRKVRRTMCGAKILRTKKLSCLVDIAKYNNAPTGAKYEYYLSKLPTRLRKNDKNDHLRRYEQPLT